MGMKVQGNGNWSVDLVMSNGHDDNISMSLSHGWHRNIGRPKILNVHTHRLHSLFYYNI